MQLLAPRRFATFLLLAMIGSYPSLAADLTPAEVVLKHLDAIGSAQVRANIKSRVVQGGTTYRLLVGGTGAMDGRYIFASEGSKSNMLFKVNATGYRGEQFICNGDKTSVAGTYLDKSRSEFGTFVLTQDILLRDNLLGGVWSSGWALLDLESHRAKLRYEGMKKVDGRDLIVLRYQPRKSIDLEIFLYFDPQTYQHVMSTYKVVITAGIGLHGETSSAQRQQARYQIEERFSEFQTKEGLTLPNHYDLRFSSETANGFAKAVEWEVRAINILNGESIDPRSFQVQ